jgi:putative flippase GtrA
VKTPSIVLEVWERIYHFFDRYAFIHQFSKFTIVGILNTIVGYGLFFIFVGYINYLLATILSHIIAVTHSYIWNRYWVFPSHNPVPWEFLKFNSVYLIVLLENLVLMFCFVSYFAINPRIAGLLILPITTLISYFGHRHWSFKTHIKK